jgi:hypothetical protein
MADELRNHGYRLPTTTSYNDLQIPFAYPPLGIYLVALIADLTGRPLLDVVRWLPPVIGSLAILAFARLAGRLLCNPLAVIAAVTAFVLLPRATVYFIVGGGVTRAPGLLFALLMLAELVSLYRDSKRWRVATVAVCAALTILSHPSAALLALYGGGLLWLAYGRARQATADTFLAAILAVVLSAPWWLTIVTRHGADVLTRGQVT